MTMKKKRQTKRTGALLLALLLILTVASSGGCGKKDQPSSVGSDTTQSGTDLNLIKEEPGQTEDGAGDSSSEQVGNNGPENEGDAAGTVSGVIDDAPPEDGEYTSKDDVAAYLHAYGHLPSNFITKKEAKALGWVAEEGNLGKVAPGKSIGGDYFGNYEGLLPQDKEYHECDIDSKNGKRGAKRIVYSDDGYIYYTEDHYESFELLYEGEE